MSMIKKKISVFENIPLLLAIAGLLVYGNTLFNKFVWTDYGYVINNPLIMNFKFSRIFESSTTAINFYRPLSSLVLTIEYFLFHEKAFLYHFVQILFAITNTSLLFNIFKKFFTKNISFFLSLIYLIHPIKVFQVAFISSINDQLYILFGLLALSIAIKDKQNNSNIISASVFLLLSLLAKEAGILFLLAATFFQILLKTKNVKKYILSSALVLLIYTGMRFFTHGFPEMEQGFDPFNKLTLMQRLINVPQIIFFYINKFFLPVKIGGLHREVIATMNISNFFLPLLLSLVFFGLLVSALLFISQRNPKMLRISIFFLFIYVAGQAMYLQIIPLDYSVSSNWFAFPMIGLLGILGGLASTIKINVAKMTLVKTGIISICILLACFTINQNTYWYDDESLFTYFASVSDNFGIESGLATMYLNKHNYEEALKHEFRSVAMFPYDGNLTGLMILYDRLGDSIMAEKTAQRALNAENHAPKKHQPPTYIALIEFFLRQNEMALAEKTLTDAVTDYPDEPGFWKFLAVVQNKLQKKEQAKRSIEKAYEVAQTHKISQEIPQIQQVYREIMVN
jgi:tetratricopeptide (TPR) repeat protein